MLAPQKALGEFGIRPTNSEIFSINAQGPVVALNGWVINLHGDSD